MKMLDLFCGSGLASWGYWTSGRFHTIVGIDINDGCKRQYAFDFICDDAMLCDYDFLSQFDFIHASPPCQAYSKITPRPERHIRLVAAAHLMLHAANKPYVIENVEGSSRELRPNIVMNGGYFNLASDRRRYFYASTLVPARHLRNRPATHKSIHHDSSRANVIAGLGLDTLIPGSVLRNITVDAMLQGIAPIMTKTIAEKMFKDKAYIG